MASIQGIYIALFGRPADPLGLDFFNTATSNGANLTAIGNLSGTAEYQDRFVGQSDAQVVTAIYQSLFGRNPDLAGLAFFTAQLQSGAQSINTIAINILDGAQGPDLALVNAKIVAANQFTAAVAVDFDALAAYQGDEGIEFGQTFIQQIDAASDVLTNAQVAAQVKTFGETVSEGPNGDSFVLTAGTDFADVDGAIRNAGNGDGIASNFRFTTSNEEVKGNNLTSSALDTLSDNSTTDNDRLVLSASGNIALVGATTSNIEAIEVDFSSYSNGNLTLNSAGAKSLDLDGSLTAALTIGAAGLVASGITNVDGSGLTSLVNGFTANFSTATGTTAFTVIGSGAADVITGADGNDVITGGAGNDTISGGAGADTLDGGAGNDTVNGGSGNDTITGGDGVNTLNGDAGNDIITGGAGVDTINGGDGNDTIVGGGGADIINAGNGTDTVTGGAGNDVITLTVDAASDIVVFEATASDNGSDTVFNFLATGPGFDKIDVTAFLTEDVSYVELAANSVGGANAGFNAVDSNVVVLAYDVNVDDLAELTAAIGTDASDLKLGIDAHTVVGMQDVGGETNFYYVTTNGLGDVSDIALVGTFDTLTAANLSADNFI